MQYMVAQIILIVFIIIEVAFFILPVIFDDYKEDQIFLYGIVNPIVILLFIYVTIRLKTMWSTENERKDSSDTIDAAIEHSTVSKSAS